MTTWHLYPTYTRLVDGSHVRVLLVLDATTGGLLAAAPIPDDEAVESVLEQALHDHGDPDAVYQMVSNVFDDVTTAVGECLARQHLTLDRDGTITGEQLERVIVAGRAASQALDRGRPATIGDIASACEAMVVPLIDV